MSCGKQPVSISPYWCFATHWCGFVLQTIFCLHDHGNLAHLDVTGSNIMLRREGYEAWDQLRLLNFGFSRFCSGGRLVLFAQLTHAVALIMFIRSMTLFVGTPSTGKSLQIKNSSLTTAVWHTPYCAKHACLQIRRCEIWSPKEQRQHMLHLKFCAVSSCYRKGKMDVV